MLALNRIISTVDSHTCGQPTRIATDGFPPLRGDTMGEKMAYASRELDDLRALLMLEPRGHRDMYGAVLTAPTMSEADFGLVYMNTLRYTTMCGHATIGAATTVVKMGMIEPLEPSTNVVFETPVGLIRTRVASGDRHVGDVSFANAPVFVDQLDVSVEVRGLGRVPVDIVFSGGFFALVDVRLTGLALDPGNATALANLGVTIRRAVNDQISVQHPERPYIDSVEAVEFHAPVEDLDDGTWLARNTAIFGQNTIDRSPCGTGTGARMAVLHARGELEAGQSLVSESLIGTRFTGRIVKEITVAGRRAIVPSVSGRAFLTGFHRFVLEPEDPFQRGFSISGHD